MKKSIGFGVAMMLVGTVIGAGLTVASTKVFKDVNEGDWFYNDVQKLVEYGILNGYEDSTFRPGQSVNRAELAAILSRYDAYLMAKYHGEDIMMDDDEMSDDDMMDDEDMEENNDDMVDDEDMEENDDEMMDDEMGDMMMGENGVITIAKSPVAGEEMVTIHYEFAEGADLPEPWIGIVPASTERTEAATDEVVMGEDEYYWAYIVTNDEGTIELKAPTTPGTYEIRLFSADEEGELVDYIVLKVE